MADAPETGSAPPDDDVKKGETTRNVLHGGRIYPAGTKASEIPDLSADQKSRLTDLGAIKD